MDKYKEDLLEKFNVSNLDEITDINEVVRYFDNIIKNLKNDVDMLEDVIYQERQAYMQLTEDEYTTRDGIRGLLKVVEKNISKF